LHLKVLDNWRDRAGPEAMTVAQLQLLAAAVPLAVIVRLEM
jgi:hypothetical protein